MPVSKSAASILLAAREGSNRLFASIRRRPNARLSSLKQVILDVSRFNEVSQYCIKPPYRHREDNAFFDDTQNNDNWQRELYEIAAEAATKLGARKVIDVGCGSGFKLVKYFPGCDTVGLDLEPTVTFLKSRYPTKEWRVADLADHEGPADIVVCADVIEHVRDPDRLMRFLSRINARRYFVSTPERQLVYNWNQSGPPENPAHCREWTLSEFRQYVGLWFDVVDVFVTNRRQATQKAVLKPLASKTNLI